MVAITAYGILLALSAVSVQATQAVPVASLASGTVLCEPVMHVVLEGNEVTIYDPAIHGEGAHLRLFEKYTSPCVNGLKLSYNTSDFSPRTDIQSRSASDLAERGIFSWALSKLFWAGVAGVTGGIFGAVSCGIDILKHGFSIGDFACVATSVFTAVGGGFATWDALASSLSSANAARDFQQVWELTDLAFGSTQEAMLSALSKKRSVDNAESNVNSTGVFDELLRKHQVRPAPPSELFHADTHEPVHWYHLLAANETHPVSLYHHGKYHKDLNATLNVWTTYNKTTDTVRMHHAMPLTASNGFIPNPNSSTSAQAKRNCDNSWASEQEVREGQLEICYPSGTPNPAAPKQSYFGYDLYGAKWAEQEWSADLGTRYDVSNGYTDALIDMSEDINSHNWWETCVCAQTQGTWVATGSFQYSWDGVYNGYSPCWKANCDGANTA